VITVADVHKFDLDVAGVVPGWCLWSDIEVAFRTSRTLAVSSSSGLACARSRTASKP
jgi:hypothetical protein